MTVKNEPIEDAEKNCEQVDPDEAKIAKYSSLVGKCFAQADELLQSPLREPAIISGVALAIFNRSTREMPEQGKIFATALEYLTMLMDKEAESKYMPPVVTNMPSADANLENFAMPCKHEGLKKLRGILMYRDAQGEERLSLFGDQVIDAIIVKQSTTFVLEMLMCPECRALLSVEKFKDGTLWDEEGEKAEEEAEEEDDPDDPNVYLGSFIKKRIPCTVFYPPPTCSHPGLRRLYHYWTVGGYENIIHEIAATLIEAMTVSGAEGSPDFLLCSRCRSLIPVDEFKAGKLQSLSPESSRKAAMESDQERRSENERKDCKNRICAVSDGSDGSRR